MTAKTYAAIVALAALLPNAATAASESRVQSSLYARVYGAKLRAKKDASGLLILRARYALGARWSAGGAYEYVTAGPFSSQPRTSTVLESYIGYATDHLSAKVGNQLFSSPWARSHDVYGSAPAAFQGLDAQYTFEGGSAEVANMVRFHGPADGGFTRTSLLGNTGGFQYLRLTASPPRGAYNVSAYAYHVQDLVNILWTNAFVRVNPRGWSPSITLQGGIEKSTGAPNAGNARSAITGMELDLQPSRTISLQADVDTIALGGWRSPYSDGYAGDPLFTTSLIDGMVDRRKSGTSEYASITYTSLNGRFTAFSSYAWYDYSDLLARLKTTEWDTVGTYYFSPKGTGAYKGLLVRAGHVEQHESPSARALHYSRIQLEYSS